MNVLHILRSEPDALARRLIGKMSQDGAGREVPLYMGQVDYDRLVADIFQSDMVICWWAGRTGDINSGSDPASKQSIC